MNSRNIRRKYGQNYLKDPSVLYKMASVISPQDSQNFLEIGPGYGALTEQLNLKNVNVIGVDVDSTNIEFLKNKFKGPANFKFVRENILEYKIHGHNHRIVGNLPYNISTQIILKLLNNYEQIIDMHFLVQKEVAEKITGQVGTKNWGKLGVKISAFFDSEILFDVPPDAFDIKPKVDSSFLRFIPNEFIKMKLNIKENLFKLIDLAFTSKRKNIKNNLKDLDINWDVIDINPTKRPEELCLEEFLYLSKNVMI